MSDDMEMMLRDLGHVPTLKQVDDGTFEISREDLRILLRSRANARAFLADTVEGEHVHLKRLAAAQRALNEEGPAAAEPGIAPRDREP